MLSRYVGYSVCCLWFQMSSAMALSFSVIYDLLTC